MKHVLLSLLVFASLLYASSFSDTSTEKDTSISMTTLAGTFAGAETGRRALAARLMTSFAERTGLQSNPQQFRPQPQKRYLWTDAYALCNFIELSRTAENDQETSMWRSLAAETVTAVHNVLGKHRPDDQMGRRGWISGLSEEEGARHPTAGGLRIGKAKPEAFDSAGRVTDDWDSDGQYFHYLTKWMHALLRYGSAFNMSQSVKHAAELVQAIHPAFTHRDQQGLRVFWKLSTDLSQPAVYSQGHHDPLDGWVSYLEVEKATEQFTFDPAIKSAAVTPILELESVVTKAGGWGTEDTLGLGGLLTDCWRVANLLAVTLNSDRRLVLHQQLAAMLSAGAASLSRVRIGGTSARRLAFREFGLSIGLQSIHRFHDELLLGNSDPSNPYKRYETMIAKILEYEGLIADIHDFWKREENRNARTWTDHQDINDAMFATSLLPRGFLAPAFDFTAATG